MGYEAIEVMIELQQNDVLNTEVFTRTKIIDKDDVDGLRPGAPK
jgi:ribose transport system substrate-binding protein